MAYRSGEPVIRRPPLISGDSPDRRRVHWDDRPGYGSPPVERRGRPRAQWDDRFGYGSPPGGFPPGGGSPPYGYIHEGTRRFGGESPPQRYLEAPPPGYQESPSRRFPRRPPPPPQYLSPEDSPPYRYIEEPPRLAGPAYRRPYDEDDRLPYDIDGRPPPGFAAEGPRRFAGGYPGHPRFGGSESPSPPHGYGPPPPPPGERRFGSPPLYADEPPRRFGGGTTPPRQFFGGSPQRYEDEPPRRFGGGTTPPRQNDAPGRFAGTPPRRPDGPPPLSPPRGPPHVSPPHGPRSPTHGYGPPPVSPPQGPRSPAHGYGPPLVSPPHGPRSPAHGYGPPPRSPPQGQGPPPLSPSQLGPTGSGPPPRYSPDVFAAAAASPPSAPGSEVLQPRRSDGSPPEMSLGGTPPGYPGRSDQPAYATPTREPYRPPPPGLGLDSDLLPPGYTGPPLVPPGYATPPRGPPGTGGSPPEFFFVGLPRRHPDGYTARTPPREPPLPPRMGNDEIRTSYVPPIVLNDDLKEVQPHPGNPGSSTGGGWKDLWVAFVFLLHIGGIAALCIIFGLQGLTSTIQNYDRPNAFHINDWFPQLAAAAVVGAGFACLWQNAIRIQPVLMILVTIWTGAAVMILFGIVLIATGKSTGLIGLAFLFVGLCQGLYTFVVRERIPFAGEMLKKVVSVCTTYPSTFAVSYMVVLLSLGWLALWIFGLSGSGVRPRHVVILLGLIASLVWTMQVLRNIVRVTVAGTVALFYFQERNMPRMPTYVSLMRACTSSFGSICLGSLFVPLVEAPFHALGRINSQAGASEFLFSCVVCLLACFERLVRYFNKMGYIQVAIYGKPFVRASKDTYDMLRAQEVDVLVRDDLTTTVLFLACGIGGSLSALVGGVWSFIAAKNLSVVISLISYLIGFLITYLTMAVLESGVATYYVCFAEDPASLQRHDGPFYERMWVRQMELQSPVTELTT